ncbi:MAG: Pyridoxine 5'-phosphate synthase [Legionellaceae bacterium]
MKKRQIRLGVNIDHIATLRQARGTLYPDPIYAALIAEESGADTITIHLREDKRHIQPRDVEVLRNILTAKLNLEMAITPEMIAFALKVKPDYCCLVPEKRQELTTEGGLDILHQMDNVREACDKLTSAGIQVSLFIDASYSQIEAAKMCNAPIIEIHTGHYANATKEAIQQKELQKIQAAAKFAHQLGLEINAGHGLHYHNVQAIAAIPTMVELNIGHAIIARAVFTGMKEAVKEMKHLMTLAIN